MQAQHSSTRPGKGDTLSAQPPLQQADAQQATTSNFMIGVTAAASAGIYFSRGDIPPLIAAPVALGILLGALIGARLLAHLSNRILRIIFLVVIVVAAIVMVLHGIGIA